MVEEDDWDSSGSAVELSLEHGQFNSEASVDKHRKRRHTLITDEDY